MRILIRHIRRTGNQGSSGRSTLRGEVVSVGRATDQTIQLQDRALPPAFRDPRGRQVLIIKATGEEHFFVGGKRARSARLAVGDTVEIGEYAITRIERRPARTTPRGRGRRAVRVRGVLRDRLPPDLIRPVSPSAVSLALFFSILVAFLAIPAAGLLDRDLGIALATCPSRRRRVGLGQAPPSHQFMGDDCTACHVKRSP